MKSLIKPTFAMSFVLMLTGLLAFVPWYMPLFGLISLALSGILGVVVLGHEDKDYVAQLELVRLEHLKAVQLVDATEKKYVDLLNQVSKALSENRELAGHLR